MSSSSSIAPSSSSSSSLFNISISSSSSSSSSSILLVLPLSLPFKPVLSTTVPPPDFYLYPFSISPCFLSFVLLLTVPSLPAFCPDQLYTHKIPIIQFKL
ncbi:hypothetical protein Hanom_Chr08g00691761 [Helianthus anomalus]